MSTILSDAERQRQTQRLRRIIQGELTETQRRVLQGHYYENKTITQLAREMQVNKSSVCRTLQRAQKKLRQFLQY